MPDPGEVPLIESVDACTGAYDCPAMWHIHGCYGPDGSYNPDHRSEPLTESDDEPTNPLDVPPLTMTDDEWRAWCEFLGIDCG